MFRRSFAAALLCAAALFNAGARAQDVVRKQVFEAGSYRTRGGGTIADTLNAAGDDAILIAHLFSGNSHAFGRLAPDGPTGDWDAIVANERIRGFFRK